MTEPATPGYQFTMLRACGHEETVTLFGNQTRRNEQRRRARVEVCAECANAVKPVTLTSPVLARLIEEVRIEDPAHPRVYDRYHSRHNRS